MQISINENIKDIKLISQDGLNYQVSLGDKVLSFDLIKINQSSYSILIDNKSYSVEVVKDESSRNKYKAVINNAPFEVNVIDALAKYLQKRDAALGVDGIQVIASAMPGKIVKVLVEEKQEVKEGDVVIIVEAMKMESELKSVKDGVVTKVHVKAGDLVEQNVSLITIE